MLFFNIYDIAQVLSLDYNFNTIGKYYTLVSGPDLFWLLILSIIFYFLLYVILSSLLNSEEGISSWKGFFRHHSNVIFDQNDGIKFIKVEDLSKKFKCKNQIIQALNHVNFEIYKGETISLIGSNGCGKTTLIKALTGSLQCDTGKLYLFENPKPFDFSCLRNYLGVCFQDNYFFPVLNLYDHLRFFATIRGVPKELIDREINNLTDMLNLENSFKTKAIDLSGGQKRKLSVAIALIGSPCLVIMDEPTSGVDIMSCHAIWKTIGSFNNKTTCLVSSHNLEEAESISSRLFIMRDGELVFDGNLEELRKEFKCGYFLNVIGDHCQMDKLLDLVKPLMEGAEIVEQKDSIFIPNTEKIIDVLRVMESEGSQYGMESYTLTTQTIEAGILKMIVDEENQEES